MIHQNIQVQLVFIESRNVSCRQFSNIFASKNAIFYFPLKHWYLMIWDLCYEKNIPAFTTSIEEIEVTPRGLNFDEFIISMMNINALSRTTLEILLMLFFCKFWRTVTGRIKQSFFQFFINISRTARKKSSSFGLVSVDYILLSIVLAI